MAAFPLEWSRQEPPPSSVEIKLMSNTMEALQRKQQNTKQRTGPREEKSGWMVQLSGRKLLQARTERPARVEMATLLLTAHREQESEELQSYPCRARGKAEHHLPGGRQL